MRVTHHLVVLGLLGAMTLSSVGARWGDAPVPTVMAAPSPSPVTGLASQSVVGSLAASGGSGTLPFIAAGAASPTPGVPAASLMAAPPPTPAPGRQWIQNFRVTELFDGPGAQATSLGTLPQFTTIELVEQSADGRSKMFDRGRGAGRLPGVVWADVADFGPSGSPKYEFELANGGEVDAGTGRRAPERILTGWPQLPTAESAVIVDGDSGVVLYAKSAHTRLPHASTTKIMTALVAIERGNLGDRVTVDVDSGQLYLTTESTVMGLMPGQTVSLETLLYGLMLSSGNDAAIAIAKHIGGSEPRFIEMMNEKARELGLRDTQYRNPHGLDAAGHFSSAYDLAQLSRYAMQNSTFYSLSATRHWNADGFDLWNLNKLLTSYPGADGVKPGFTDNAGRCLVGSAVRDNRRVFVTVLHSEDTTSDSRALLDYTFESFRWPS